MRLRECASKLLFWRKEAKTGQDIICEDERTNELVINWLCSNGLKFSDLVSLLNSVGLEAPITLAEFTSYSTFGKCVASSGRTVNILLSFNTYEIHIKEWDVTSKYSIKRKMENGVIRRVLYLQKKEICRDGKVLNGYYNEFSCKWKLKIDEIHCLAVMVCQPEMPEKKEMMLLQNNDAIEEYLIRLDNCLIVNDVYQKLVELLDFSDEILEKTESFIVSYEEAIADKRTSDKRTVIRQLVEKSWGKTVEYADIQEGNTYHVCDTGYCEFVSDTGIIISYSIKTGKASLEWYANKEVFADTDLNELVNNVIATFERFYKNNEDC